MIPPSNSQVPRQITGTILVVNDNEVLRRAVSRLLRQAGYELIEAGTGEAAVSLVRDHVPDLVLLDIALPDIDGFEVCRQIKADGMLSGVMVVHFTGSNTSPEDRVRGLSTGADGYIVQPIGNEELLARVETVLRLKQTRDQLRAAEQRQRLLMELANDAIFVADAETGRLLDANRRAEELIGRPVDEIRGLHQADLHPPEERERYKAMFRQQVSEEKAVTQDLLVVHRSGRRIPVDVSASVIKINGRRIIQGIFRDVSERHRALAALQASEAHFRSVVENVSDMIVIVDEHGLIEFASPSVERALGYAPETITSRPAIDFVHPEDHSTVAEALTRAVAGTSTTATCEFRVAHADGSLRILESRGRRLPPEAGRSRVVVIARDITARNESEQTLIEVAEGVATRPSGEFFQSMAAQLAKAVKAPFALVGELLPGKPERVRTLGFHARGATQENFDYELAGTPCERVVGKNLCCHVRGIRAEFPADDMLRDMACEGYVGTPLIAPDGRVLGLIAVLYQQPIQKPETVKTLVRIFAARAAAELAQLRAEETSHQTTALQSAVLDALPAAVVVLDGAGRIQRVNRGWESVATARDPAPASDWTGRPYSQVCSRVLHLDTRDANRLIAGILGVRTGQRKEWQAECATVAGRSWKLLAAPLPRPEGLGVVVMHIDVTEQRKLEEQLRQSQKMEAIGQLAGGIAHDFNNLLTVIYGHLSLLQDSQGLSPEDRTLLQDAEFAAERASALTRQLLTFSRHQQMRLVPVDLSDTVRSTSRLLARVLGEEITLDLDLAPRLGAVEADAGMIGQVLLNFAVNARDAMTGTGRLTIRTCEQTLAEARLEGGQRILPGHYIVLSVQDIGSGIAPENLSRIFEPFFTTKESGRGTGIGLATVYSIVQQHRGVVTVQSKLGGGSTFTVYLPATPGQVGQARERTSRPELPRGSETVLLVEDDPHVRHTVSYALERRGYRIIEAVSGPDALEVWARERDQIALVLTDMVLPGGLSGLELGQRFQAEKADMKVIYMSGYNPSQSAADVELTPGVNFLQKPFLLTELIQLIRARLNA